MREKTNFLLNRLQEKESSFLTRTRLFLVRLFSTYFFRSLSPRLPRTKAGTNVHKTLHTFSQITETVFLKIPRKRIHGFDRGNPVDSERKKEIE